MAKIQIRNLEKGDIRKGERRWLTFYLPKESWHMFIVKGKLEKYEVQSIKLSEIREL